VEIGPSSYFCETNVSTVTFSLSSSSVLYCNANETCRTMATPYFVYCSASNYRYCAPGASCSILEPCNITIGECTLNASSYVILIDDSNDDGRLDLAVTFVNQSSVGTLIGYGNGSFATPIVVHTSLNPSSIVIADFNNDKR
ncbi:unnamed protein product, partial [Rotaria magnacalcarata]